MIQGLSKIFNNLTSLQNIFSDLLLLQNVYTSTFYVHNTLQYRNIYYYNLLFHINIKYTPSMTSYINQR